LTLRNARYAKEKSELYEIRARRSCGMNIPDEMIEVMVDRFLTWRLPIDFSPDGGISFTRPATKFLYLTGTNLFSADQAREMIKHMLAAPEAK